MRETGRPHSRSWIKDMDCSTIIHELLHLAGLVDEYPEAAMGYVRDPATGSWIFVQSNAEKAAFDCRKIYETNSVMGYHAIAWANTLANWELQVNFCSCNQGDGCQAFLEDQKMKTEELLKKGPSAYSDAKVHYPSQCPSGFIKNNFSYKYPIPEDIKKQYDEGKMLGGFLPKGMTIEDLQKMPQAFSVKSRSPAERNILEPRHFNAIVFPGCTSRNRAYYQDSINAYRTSEKNGGKGCADLSWSGK